MKLFNWSAATAAAVALLALLVASSASAARIDLCKIEESPCTGVNRWFQGVNFEAKAEPLKFLTTAGAVECTSSTFNGPLGEGGEPQTVTLNNLKFDGCKLGGTSCTISVLSIGGVELLKTNFNLGEATFANTEIKVVCGLFISCKYGGISKLHLLGKNGVEPAKLTASEVAMPGGTGFLCPANNKLDATFTISTPVPVYVME